MGRRAQPFEERIDRSGEHHLWTAARKADGTGQVRIAGKPFTAPHVAWKRAFGPVPVWQAGQALRSARMRAPGASLPQGRSRLGAARERAAKATGSKGQVRKGVWKLTVTAGRYDDGRAAACTGRSEPGRRHRPTASSPRSSPRCALARPSTAGTIERFRTWSETRAASLARWATTGACTRSGSRPDRQPPSA
jgi:hypothetical protein